MSFKKNLWSTATTTPTRLLHPFSPHPLTALFSRKKRKKTKRKKCSLLSHHSSPESSQWRPGPPDKPCLCNACGSRYYRMQSLEDYVPRAVKLAASNGACLRFRCLPWWWRVTGRERGRGGVRERRKTKRERVKLVFFSFFNSPRLSDPKKK